MRQARAADATTVVTIFVNLRQFTVADDYTKYPRNEARDPAMPRPRASTSSLPGRVGGLSTRLRHGRPVGAVARPLEGPRPGHFDGVATVVAILLTWSRTMPTSARRMPSR
jgi:pantoate--beta-alanine ligase